MPEQSTNQHFKLFTTPDTRNMRVVEVVNTQLPGVTYPTAVGTIHPNLTLFPAHRLTLEAPMENKPGWVRRVYATAELGEDAYNYQIKFSGESNAHPIYLRAYLYLRVGYAPVAKGTVDPVFGGAILVAEELRNSDDADVSNSYIEVIRAYETLPGPPLTGKVLSSTHGGGLLDTVSQKVLAGTTVAPDFKTVSAQVSPTSSVVSQLETVSLPPGETWPTLTESEYVTELGVFVSTEKTVVAIGTVTPSIQTVGGFIVVTEFKDVDHLRTIKIVSKFPSSAIGSTRTFRKSIQYSIPDEIPVTPAMIKAVAVTMATPPWKASTGLTNEEYNAAVALYNEKLVTDAELDYGVEEGYSGPFSAEVTRTISLSSATEEAYQWFPRTENRKLPVSLGNSSVSRARGKILHFQTPAAIHGEWDIPVADVWTVTGSRQWVWDTGAGGVRGALAAGYPKDFAVGVTLPPVTALWWSFAPILSKSTVNFTAAATTPAAIPHGEKIIVVVNSELWRFGVFINDVYRITVP